MQSVCVLQSNFYFSIHPSLKTLCLSANYSRASLIPSVRQSGVKCPSTQKQPTRWDKYTELCGHKQEHMEYFNDSLSLSLFLVRRGSYKWTSSAPFTAVWMGGSALSLWKPRSTNHSQTSPRADQDTFSQCQATRGPGDPRRSL